MKDEALAVLLWWLDYVVLPLATAAYLLLARWGHDNLAYVIALPVFFLFWRMYIRSPKNSPAGKPTAVRNAMRNAHALDIAGLLFLMVFEAAVAIVAEARDSSASSSIMLCLLFLGYLVLALGSERHRGIARRLMSADAT